MQLSAVGEQSADLAALRHSGELANLALAALPGTSVMVFDRDLRYVLCAGGALAQHGYDPAALEGRTLREVLPADRAARLEPVYRAALSGRPTSFRHDALDGRTYDVEVSPVETPAGIVGGLLISRDCTAHTSAQRALAARERGFRELAERTSDVVSRSDADGVYRYVSPAAARVYGRQPSELLGRPVRDFLHPEDHERHAVLRAELLAGRDEHIGEFRIPHALGHWVWVEVRYIALRDAAGVLVGVQAASRDISDRKAAEAARRVADLHFQTAFDGAPIGMALVSLTGDWLRVNQALCTLLGRDEVDLLSSTFQDITHPEDLDGDLQLLQETLTGARDSYQMEKRYLHVNGRVVWALLSVSIVRDEDGEPLHFVSQIQDISERRRLEAELQRLASHDDLTGLCNRRAFERELTARLDEGAEGVLVLLDLDGFKAVNDAHGHHAGDAVLRHVADLLREELGEEDVVARLGGDEFAALIRRGTREDTEGVVAAMTRRLDDVSLAVDGRALRARASVGSACLREQPDGESALRVADAAMYAVKRERAAAA